MGEVDMYLAIVMIVAIFFIAVLKKILKHLDENGFAAGVSNNQSIKEKLQKVNFYEQRRKDLKNIQSIEKIGLYDKLCEFISSKILELKEEVNEDGKERLASLLKELSMVQGQNSNEEKMQKNLFHFLRELEECVKEISGEEKAQNLKEEIGKKYNELFS